MPVVSIVEKRPKDADRLADRLDAPTRSRTSKEFRYLPVLRSRFSVGARDPSGYFYFTIRYENSNQSENLLLEPCLKF